MNSDYFPFLDISAARTRFLQKNALELTALAAAPVPAIEMLAQSSFAGGLAVPPPYADLPAVTVRAKATALLAYLKDPTSDPYDQRLPVDFKRDVAFVRALQAQGQCAAQWDLWLVSFYNVATGALPFLTREETTHFWQGMDLSHCMSTLTPVQKRWLALFHAIGVRDAIGMRRLATALLAEERRIRHQHKEFLLAAGMLGSLAQGDRKHAELLWNTYGESVASQLERPLLFQLLLAHTTR